LTVFFADHLRQAAVDFAGLDPYAALSANPFPAARGVDMHTGFQRRPNKGISGFCPDTAIMGYKPNDTLFHEVTYIRISGM
jgi:hypothetical protein